MWTYRKVAFRVAKHQTSIQGWSNSWRSLVIPASHFGWIKDSGKTKTAEVYSGAPLAALSPKARGEVIATVARAVMGDLRKEDILIDAFPGQRVDGCRRSQNHAEYDWLCNGRRVECKSSQLHFIVATASWRFQFAGVKLASHGQRTKDAFDDLILVLYVPDRLYIYQHDLITGVASAGKATPSRGHNVRIESVKTMSWREGLESILAKLDAGSNACRRIVDLSLGDHRVNAEYLRCRAHGRREVYENVPLASISPSARGLVLERLAREIDVLISPGAFFSTPSCDNGIPVRGRSEYTAPYDSMRDGVRVECKSSQLHWSSEPPHWSIKFVSIKMATHMRQSSAFDELHLVIFSPRGIYIYHHDLQLGVSSSGIHTQAEGCNIAIRGPRNLTCWSKSLDVILSKLDRAGCPRIAFVPWD